MPAHPIEFLHSGLTRDVTSEVIPLPGGLAHWLAQGVLQMEPATSTDLDPVIISVGVHGDETVPIRLLDHWLRQFAAQETALQRSVLLILANPLAVRAGTRFVEHNMNRLFTDDVAEQDHPEAHRTTEIMTVVQSFIRRHPNGLHLDLHSTIKPSDRDRFALVPVQCADRDNTPLMQWFQRFGVDGWVQNRSVAATFSSFTGGQGYLSATLELGQVTSINEPIDRFLPLVDELTALATGPAPASDHHCQGYAVVREIVRPEGDFEVCITDFVNFRALSAGTLIARGEGETWEIEQDGDALLFLNGAVPVGHRVALVVRPE